MTTRLLITKLALAVVGVLALAPGAMASVSVGSGAVAPKLRVDAKGNAEVSYTQGGVRKTVLVPAKGAVIYGGRLAGRDVSKAVASPRLPYLKALRKGPHGWIYALDVAGAHRPARAPLFALAGRADEAHVHREPGERRHLAHGKVTYAGKPIPTSSAAPGGRQGPPVRLHRPAVGGKWKVVGGVTVKTNGTYQHMLYGGQSGRGLPRQRGGAEHRPSTRRTSSWRSHLRNRRSACQRLRALDAGR